MFHRQQRMVTGLAEIAFTNGWTAAIIANVLFDHIYSTLERIMPYETHLLNAFTYCAT